LFFSFILPKKVLDVGDFVNQNDKEAPKQRLGQGMRSSGWTTAV